MAKRTRARKAAPARRSRATQKAKKRAYPHTHLPLSRRYSYTPALLADGRRRYERTEEPVTAIAADFGIDKTTFQRMANREHWVRYRPPPRDLSPAAKLALEAAALAQTPLIPAQAATQGPDCGGTDSGSEDFTSARAGPHAPPGPDTIARMLAAVENELATVVAMRACMKAEPQRPVDADVTARTLARLTAAVRDLQHMRRAQAPSVPSQPGYDHDDMPADLDAFRHELARRIAAFMESRPDDDDAAEPAASAPDRPRA